MKQLLLSCLSGWIAYSPAWGGTEYRLGGADGNAWPTALSLEGSSAYVVLDADGQEQRRVEVRGDAARGGDRHVDRLFRHGHPTPIYRSECQYNAD